MLGFALGLPFCMCAKLQGDQSMGSRFIAIFASVQKHEEEKKTRKKFETLAARISEMAEAIVFKFGMQTPWLVDNSVTILVPIR